MERFDVKTASGVYPVVVGSGVRVQLGELLAGEKDFSGLFLVTDSNVDRLYGQGVMEILSACTRPVEKLVVPAGESSKSPDELLRLWRELIRAGCDRSSLVVALGGGVVGDLAGFAAASVLRGIRFLQVPTTLLAMVDASVGGKTGIDLPEGKNLVGAFHQPQAVVMDIDFLGTLPEREMGCGWAEVIKTAAIRDAALFQKLEEERTTLLDGDARSLADVVGATARIKADVVEADEKESGLRRILNFGHTLAHGIETGAGYADWLHGEAVSVGMVFASELGESLGVTREGTSRRLRACLEAYGLPVSLSGVSPEGLLEIMERDKKKGPGGIRWVLLEQVGEATVSKGLPRDRIEGELQRFLEA